MLVVSVTVAVVAAGSAASSSAEGSSTRPTVASSVAGETADAVPAGVLLFMRQDEQGLWKSWTACPDMSHAQQIPTRDGHNAAWGVWSPDGTRIAFNADYDDPDLGDNQQVWDIYTMDPDGGNVTRLTHSFGLDPGYSPDGTLIVFSSTEPGREGIWVMDAADGGNERLVSATPAGFESDFAPRFSPDGTKIVFSRGRSFDAFDYSLYVINVDGSGLSRITPEGVSSSKPAWSPDGSTILFDGYSAEYPSQNLWTVQPDGTGLTALDLPSGTASNPEGYADPAWSPDGSTIIVGHGQHQGSPSATVSFAMLDSDGTGLRWVQDGSSDEHRPEWGIGTC